MLNNEFPPLGGGTGTVNQAILQRLACDPDLEVDLVTSAEGEEPSSEQFSERVRIYRQPVQRFNIHHASNRELLTYAWQAVKTGFKLHRSRRYDLCLAWSAVPAGGSALALRRLTGLPYIVRVCGPDIPGFEQRYGVLYPLLKPAIRAVWRGAAGVVAKCQAEAEMIQAVDPGVNITLIPNGVDLERFSANSTIPDEEALRLLCVARLIERKGQRQLIQAVHELHQQGVEVTLELVGTGDAEAAYRRLAQELGVTERVNFRGYIPREEIPAVYAAAHVFVLPSHNEGMSVATLEAMASGLPVIVSRTGGIAELVIEGVNGLVFEPGDVEALKGSIRKLAEDRSLARRMAEAARKRASEFSWEIPARRFRELFDQFIKTGR